MENKTQFNKRAFTAIGMVISGIGLPYSGIMNHITGFEPMSADRHMWMSVHNMLALFFTVFSIWHVKLNWKPLLNYINKAKKAVLSREALYAATLVIFFLTLAVLHTGLRR